MNNSVFGKTLENLCNCVDIKIVRSEEEQKIRKLVASPLYARHNIFANDLVGIGMSHRNDNLGKQQAPNVRFLLRSHKKAIWKQVHFTLIRTVSCLK